MSKGICGPISTQWPEGVTDLEKETVANQGKVASAASGLCEAFRYPDPETIADRLETLLEVLPAWANTYQVFIDPNSRLARVLRLNLGTPGLPQ